MAVGVGEEGEGETVGRVEGDVGGRGGGRGGCVADGGPRGEGGGPALEGRVGDEVGVEAALGKDGKVIERHRGGDEDEDETEAYKRWRGSDRPFGERRRAGSEEPNLENRHSGQKTPAVIIIGAKRPVDALDTPRFFYFLLWSLLLQTILHLPGWRCRTSSSQASH